MVKKSKARFFRVGKRYLLPVGTSVVVVKIRPEQNTMNVQFIGPDCSTSDVESVNLVNYKKALQRGEIEEI